VGGVVALVVSTLMMLILAATIMVDVMRAHNRHQKNKVTGCRSGVDRPQRRLNNQGADVILGLWA
jgi:hypothetical protein